MSDKDIQEDNELHLLRFKENPPHPSYIAGFIDGDGCIFIRKISDGFQSGITVTQVRTNILQVMRYHFGGSITSCAKRNVEPCEQVEDNIDKTVRRNQYNWIVRSNEYRVLLDYIADKLVIKNKQLQLLSAFSKLANKPNIFEEKLRLFESCSNCNKTKDMCEKKFNNLNDVYISGLFDAEGCIYLKHSGKWKFYISINQKSHPDVLDMIKQHLGYGRISGHKFIIYSKEECERFIDMVLGHVIVKYNQCHAFLQFLRAKDNVTKQQSSNVCNMEKHKIEYFTSLNQSNDGKEGYLHLCTFKTPIL